MLGFFLTPIIKQKQKRKSCYHHRKGRKKSVSILLLFNDIFCFSLLSGSIRGLTAATERYLTFVYMAELYPLCWITHKLSLASLHETSEEFCSQHQHREQINVNPERSFPHMLNSLIYFHLKTIKPISSTAQQSG